MQCTDFYDERAAKLHVRRLRELLVNPPAQVNPTLIPAIEKKNKTNTTPKPIVTITEVPAFTLSAYLEDENSKEEIPECVSNITFSAWNPPPGNRRLQGDLAYLEITTLESNTLHITASVDGFYLNQSTSSQFNPRKHPSPYKSQTLLGLLKKASVQFSKRITSLLNRKVNSHPFESIEVPHTVNNWLSSKAEHTYDWNRAEDALLATYGMDTRGVLRDWNEEYQSCRELPSASLPERVLRDRTLYRVYSDFVEAASKGAW